MEGWTVESFCDPLAGVCYHGDEDPLCSGVSDMTRYDEMEDRADGRPVWCFGKSD